MRRLCLIAVFASAVALFGCGGGDRVIVGAGTTVVDSGLMSALEARFGAGLSIVGGSTAEILELASRGAVSVAIVHDEHQELEYLADHPGTDRRLVFASRFLIVGPADLAARFAGLSPADALAAIAAEELVFVTRADGSGTHARELALWSQAGVTPGGDWYVATGQGMGITLQVADQRKAFTLVEEGAFLAARDTIDLVPVELRNHNELINPYHAVVVDDAGSTFVEWLTGPDGRAALAAANESIFGAQVYVASGDS